MTLNEFFEKHPKAALGFSGGVDSAYLLYEGLRCGADIHPYYIRTAFQPNFEYADARRLTDQLGVELSVIELDVLSNPAVAANPTDRCYHCKAALFGALQARAQADGYPLLIDGTNASDDAVDRPGMRALRELSVLSPLRVCGLTKEEIRRRSREAGLFTWDKPAYACLATRIPANMPITFDMLHRVEQAETVLFALGFRDFRVRVFHGAARIQLKDDQIPQAVSAAKQIRARLAPYFDTVLLDLAGR